MIQDLVFEEVLFADMITWLLYVVSVKMNLVVIVVVLGVCVVIVLVVISDVLVTIHFYFYHVLVDRICILDTDVYKDGFIMLTSSWEMKKENFIMSLTATIRCPLYCDSQTIATN